MSLEISYKVTARINNQILGIRYISRY